MLIWHYQHFFYVEPAKPAPDFAHWKEPLYVALKPFYDFGNMAVEVFWCISGFIFFWKYSDLIFERVVSGRKFFVLRFSRLYPLHLVTLLAVAILQGIHHKMFGGPPFIYANNNGYHFVLNLLGISFWGLQQSASFNGPSWSISVELFAYLVFFVLASAFRYSFKSGTALVVLAVMFWWKSLLYQPLAECLVLFFLGGLVHAFNVRTQAAELKWMRNGALVASASVVLGSLAHIYTADSGTWFDGWFTAYDYINLVFAPSVVLLSVLAIPSGLSARATSAMETLGNLTYSSYMIHFPIQLMIASVCTRLGIGQASFYQPFPLLLFVVATLIGGYFVFERFEMPVQALIRNWVSTRDARPRLALSTEAMR